MLFSSFVMGSRSYSLKGVYGAYFSKLNYRWSRDVRNRTWLKNHPVLEVILVGASTVPLLGCIDTGNRSRSLLPFVVS